MRSPHIALIAAIAFTGTSPAGAVSFTSGVLLPTGAKVNDMISDGTLEGTTVVGKIDPSGGGKEAFRLDGDTLTILGDLVGGKVDSDAKAISGDGSIVVGKGDGGTNKHAIYWDGTDPTAILLSSAKSEAKAVNYDGTVIVGKTKDGPFDVAVRWDINGGIITELILGDLGGGKSEARGVSDNGEWVVGKGTNLDGEKVALLWDSGGAITEIGDLLGGKGDAVATAVNFDGSVVIGQADTDDGKEAFRWEGGEMISLGDLDGGKTDAEATGMSADGSVIVGVGTGFDGKEAFVWLESDGVMRSLKDYLTLELMIAGLDDWTFETITSISADGRTIVGFGTNPDGESQMFSAQIPEPSTFSMVALGMLGLGWAGRRRDLNLRA